MNKNTTEDTILLLEKIFLKLKKNSQMKSDDSMDPNDDLYLNQNYKYFYQVIEKDLDDDGI